MLLPTQCMDKILPQINKPASSALSAPHLQHSSKSVMAILWLFLGLLSVVGSSSPDPSTSETIFTTPAQPTTAAVASNQVTSDNPASAIVSTPAQASPTVIANSPVTTNAPQSEFTTTAKQAFTKASTDVTSGLVTSTEGHPTSTKQESIPPKGTTTNKYSASTADTTITPVPGSPKLPEGTLKTEPTQESNATKDSSTSTNSTAVPNSSLSSTESPKDMKIIPIVSSSTSPPPTMTSSKTAGGISEIATTKPAISQLPSISTTVSVSTVEFSTPKDIVTQRTTATTKVQIPSTNVKVECTNVTDKTSHVKINKKALDVCDVNGKLTEDEHALHEITKSVCKALNPEYQKNQYRCVIRLARINDEQLAITEAFIESRPDPNELYTQLRRTGASSSLFTYVGAPPEDEDVVSIPLISVIVSLAVFLLIIAAGYGCWHQRKARKREQRLTEELQTMENGYHDNPTLEVMETSPEMQEKKGGPNGELGDSWIVPLDNLTREDLEDEEDTHL